MGGPETEDILSREPFAYVAGEDPPLQFISTAPLLTGENQSTLQTIWSNFWAARGFPGVSDTDPCLLTRDGDLVHGVRGVHDLSAMKSIFESGVLSGEIELSGKRATDEDSETHYCADFWVVKRELLGGDRVGDYLQWCQTATKPGTVFRVPEKNWTPGMMNSTIALFFDPTLPSLEPILSHAGTAQAGTPLLGELVKRFPTDTDRHLAVPIGLPATAIRTVAFGARIPLELQIKIKELASSQGLHCAFVDYQGNPI